MALREKRRVSVRIQLSHESRTSLLVYGLNLVLACLFLAPLMWALAISLLPKEFLFAYPPTLWHWPPTLASYKEVWTLDGGRFGGYVRVSSLVAVLTAACVTPISGLAGYAFARLRFIGKNTIFLLILGTMMFPFTAVLIPLFSIMSQLKLINNPITLVILYTVFQLPFCTFLFRNTFEGMPLSLRDAALIDGCSELGVFRRVMVPLATPAIATVIIYSLYHSWNEFTTALIFLTSDRTTTVPVGLATFAQANRFRTRPDFILAGSVLSFIPVMVMFLLFQRFFVKGLTAGTNKG